jgi:hypothetical protein
MKVSPRLQDQGISQEGAGNKQSNALAESWALCMKQVGTARRLFTACFLYKHSFPQADYSLCYLLHHSLTLKMEVAHSSDTSADFQRNTELLITTAVRTSNPTHLVVDIRPQKKVLYYVYR